jgi:Iap family predicted aminopeptidase
LKKGILMFYRTTLIALLCGFSYTAVFSQTGTKWQSLIGAAYEGNRSYAMLQRLCDEAGGRLVGSANNARALQILESELRKLGIQSRRESFSFRGWLRGNDEVEMLTPTRRLLRTVALGYVDTHPEFQATVVFAGNGFQRDYASLDARGKIVLVTSEAPRNGSPLLRYEAIDTAAANGARAIIFIYDRPGGLTLAGVSNFQGQPSPIPAYSVTFEEGKWMQRLIENRVQVTLRMVTGSRCASLETANLCVTFPGTIPGTVVVGAHFDSWDVGQGAVDNGTGTAALFDLARLLKGHSPKNMRTVELVWFNGEELGLWGSKQYVVQHSKDSIFAMVNLDMPGSPTGFNTNGFQACVPALDTLCARLPGFALKSGVTSVPWTNSDHEPFMLVGIPSISMMGHFDNESVTHYHDLGDTFDKVNKKYLADAAAVASIIVTELANDESLAWKKKSRTETIEMLKQNKTDERLKRQKEWPF